MVSIPRVLGEPIEMLGLGPGASVAEKGITILERGITSTRWRDYVDIVQLAKHGIDRDLLFESARAVAREPSDPAWSCRGLGRRLRRGVAGQVGGMAPQGRHRVRA